MSTDNPTPVHNDPLLIPATTSFLPCDKRTKWPPWTKGPSHTSTERQQLKSPADWLTRTASRLSNKWVWVKGCIYFRGLYGPRWGTCHPYLNTPGHQAKASRSQLTANELGGLRFAGVGPKWSTVQPKSARANPSDNQGLWGSGVGIFPQRSHTYRGRRMPMGVTSNWGHPQGHHARRPPTTPPPVMISFPWNVIDITWNVSPFEFLYSFVSLVLNNTRGLLFKLLYHVLWVNKHLLNLNLKILWWYDEGYIVKKAWWSDGRTDGQAEWTYSQSCLVAAKKCQVKSGPSCGQQTFVLLYSLSFMISRPSRVGLFDFRALYKILLMDFHMCSIRRLIQVMAFDSM